MYDFGLCNFPKLLQEVDLFVTVDLFEAKNMLQVQHCLDKLRLRFGGEKISVGRAGSDVFDAPSVQGTPAPAPVAAESPAAARAPSEGASGAPYVAQCQPSTNMDQKILP